MEDDLKASLQRFVFSSQREPLVVLSRSGRLVEANRAARRLDLDLVALFDPERPIASVATFVEELSECGESNATVLTPTGRQLRLEGWAVDSHFFVTLRDVTEQKRLEEELRQLRTRASLGLVAAGVAHDFNNLLTPILITSSLLSREMPVGSRGARMAESIHTGATLAAGLTRDVLSLARPRPPTAERLEVNHAISQIRALIERLLGDDVELVMSLDERCGHALVDPSGLEHSLLNLVANAKHALPEGGSVTISTRPAQHGDDARVLVTVTDTGIGMTSEVLRRAFEGSFTTRPDAGGFGLGLASVRRFARESGGDVAIESEPMRGTTVTLSLVGAPPLDAVEELPKPSPQSARRGATVLVADRDERIRRSVAMALEPQGYVALLASTQDGALELAASHGVAVALVDERLVRRDGLVFLERLRALRSGINVVIMTDAPTSEWIPDGVIVLPKAFSDTDLLRTLQRALEPAPGPKARRSG